MNAKEIFDSGAMLHRDYKDELRMLMNEGTFISLIEKHFPAPPSDLKELKDWDEVFKEFSNKNASNKYQEAPNYAFLHFLKDNYPAPVYFPVQRPMKTLTEFEQEVLNKTFQKSLKSESNRSNRNHSPVQREPDGWVKGNDFWTSEQYKYLKGKATIVDTAQPVYFSPLPSVNEKEAVEFAEWLLEIKCYPGFKRKSWRLPNKPDVSYTSSDLYQIFLNNKQ